MKNYSEKFGFIFILSIFLTISCFAVGQNEIRFLKTDPETKTAHEVTDHSVQNVFTYSKPLLLDRSSEYLTIFATKYVSNATIPFGASFEDIPKTNGSLLELQTYSYASYFTKIEIDSKYVRICKIKIAECRFLENAGQVINAIYLSPRVFKTEYDDSISNKVNFSLIQIELSSDKNFDTRYDLVLSDLNKKYIRLIPNDSSFSDFEYDIKSNALFITVLYDSNKDGKFNPDVDRSAVLKVDANRPSIGVEIVSRAEIQQIFQLDKKNTN